MHRGIIGRVLVALGVVVVGVVIIAKAPIGTGSKPKAALLNQSGSHGGRDTLAVTGPVAQLVRAADS